MTFDLVHANKCCMGLGLCSPMFTVAKRSGAAWDHCCASPCSYMPCLAQVPMLYFCVSSCNIVALTQARGFGVC